MSYGNGIALDSDWDLIVDETGDIKASRGEDELEKDLAYISAVRLTEETGTPLIPSNFSQIENTLATVLSRDPRLNRVTEVEVTANEDNNDAIDVRLRAIIFGADEVETDLIFTVEV